MHQWKPEERVLAFRAAVRWNVQSFTCHGPMTRKKFLVPDFDACSVALFASLVLMGPLPARGAPVAPVRSALVSTRVPPGPRSRVESADRLEDDTSAAQRDRSRR
jgi:hypothetical protein